MTDDSIQITATVRAACGTYIPAANPRITTCVRCGRPANLHPTPRP